MVTSTICKSSKKTYYLNGMNLNVYLKFIALFQSEIESAFYQLQFWLNITVLDPKSFQKQYLMLKITVLKKLTN